MVPPALLEVGEEMLEGHLPELEEDGEGPAQRGITDEDGLAPPANEVSPDELIIDGVQEIAEWEGGVVRGVELTVCGIVPLRQLHSEPGIQIRYYFSGI